MPAWKHTYDQSPEKFAKKAIDTIKSNISFNFYDWFDLELRDFTGIDILADNFDSKKGYKIYNKNNFSLFLYRYEGFSSFIEKEISKFIGYPNLTLPHSNDTATKTQENIYKLVLQSCHLENSFVEKVYSGKYIRHLYTEAEINHFKNRWTQ
jgi:hypothetical protein